MAPHASRERGRATLLQGYEIAIADNLGPGWTAADVSRWVNYHGGVFNHTMGEGVTHLLATPEQFKQKLPAVKTALAFKATHIVTKDWLEDTLEKRRRRAYILIWVSFSLPFLAHLVLVLIFLPSSFLLYQYVEPRWIRRTFPRTMN